MKLGELNFEDHKIYHEFKKQNIQISPLLAGAIFIFWKMSGGFGDLYQLIQNQKNLPLYLIQGNSKSISLANIPVASNIINI